MVDKLRLPGQDLSRYCKHKLWKDLIFIQVWQSIRSDENHLACPTDHPIRVIHAMMYHLTAVKHTVGLDYKASLKVWTWQWRIQCCDYEWFSIVSTIPNVQIILCKTSIANSLYLICERCQNTSPLSFIYKQLCIFCLVLQSCLYVNLQPKCIWQKSKVITLHFHK